jgi:protein-L-isoaspartate(D-aspartate) O-methyltransferase
VDSETAFANQRAQMVADQLAGRGIRDERVLEAIGHVPRHRFVSPGEQIYAYEDRPLPILSGQTISQPYIVAYMLQALGLKDGEKVLEIGTGSGYQAALLAELAGEVYTLERHLPLVQAAQHVLADLGYRTVSVHHADGSLGWLAAAPYDAIIVAAGAPVVPQPLLQQLAPAGSLIIPVGEPGRQSLQLWHREEDGFDFEELVPVAFVPLIGAHGWEE